MEAALVELILEAESLAELRKLLQREAALVENESSAARIAAMAEFLHQHPQSWQHVRNAASAVSHARGDESSEQVLARLAQSFDAAASISPAAGVALHSLGDEERLSDMTAEVVAWLEKRGLVSRDREFLDIGCGSGRFEQALAPKVGQIVGMDISSKMLDCARRRCAGIANVHFCPTDGRGLGDLKGQSFDCVLAVDSFPYLVLAGGDIVAQHMKDAARVLRPGGSLVVLNYSYEGGFDTRRAELERVAGRDGLDLISAAPHPFRLWDGSAFHLHKGTT